MIAKTLRRAGLGFLIGMAVGNIIAALTGMDMIVSDVLVQRAGSIQAALLLQTLLSGVIGAAGMAGMTLYELEHWSLLLTMVVHYLLYMIVFLPIALFLGWITTVPEAIVMAAILAAVHMSIFLIMCAYYRAQVREINRLQELSQGLFNSSFINNVQQ